MPKLTGAAVMEGFSLSPQMTLLLNVIAFGIAIVLATQRYIREYFSAKRAAPPATTPVGDMRIWGAAFAERDALLQMAEHLKCICEFAEKSNTIAEERVRMIELSIKMGEKLSDDIRDIRKVLERRESRGNRQDER